LSSTNGTRRRAVVTGIGLVTPLGTGTQRNWQNLLAGRSGIRAITRFDASAVPARVAGEVPDFDPARFIERKDLKKMDAFIQFALGAAQLAVEDARLPVPLVAPERTGVIVGVGIGGIGSVEESYEHFLSGNLRRVSPFFIPRLIPNMAAGYVALRFGAKGPNYAVTSACASGAHAVGEALVLIRDGRQDVMLAGGAEAPVCLLSVGGFSAMRALATNFNDEPERASRPFDARREGFVIAEGAGVLVLEELEHARQRGADIYAEILGYGANCDAHHLTQPAPEGAGAGECMRLAVADAALAPEEIGYINAHGTGTPFNDAAETLAVKRVFGGHARRLAISSTKSMTGHLLGAAGTVEAAFTALALKHGMAPPTINLETPDPTCDLDYVVEGARRIEVRAALSNSFGFGGTNASLVFGRL
jgi:3-oxoacyl-[acyl-carrier-protein] synthase II